MAKVVYESDQFAVKQYGTEAVYMLVDKVGKQFIVFEGRTASSLEEMINECDGTDMTDIGLAGLFVLGHHYGQVETMGNPQ